MGDPGEQIYPVITARFFIEIGSVFEGGFKEASGLHAEVETFEYHEGGQNTFTHKLPGRTRFHNVTLKGGMTDSLVLWNWFEDVSQGTVERRDVGIVLCDQDLNPQRRWVLRDAYPVKWVGPSLKSSENTAAIEALELAHHGMEAEKA
jgi:phage tail-like protein